MTDAPETTSYSGYEAFAAAVMDMLKARTSDDNDAAALFKASTGYATRRDAFNDGATAERLAPQINGYPWPPTERSHQERPQASAPGGQQPQVKPTPLASVRKKHTRLIKSKKSGTVAPYLDAEGRILLFRAEHANWSLQTELVSVNDNGVIFKAVVSDDTARIWSVGHGYASWTGADNFGGRVPEKAETAAVSRCLGHLGISTDFVE